MERKKRPISHIGNLPQSLKTIAKSLLRADAEESDIYYCDPKTMINLDSSEDLVFQLILDQKYDKFYYVGVRNESVQKSAGDIYLPGREDKSVMYFARVSDAWLRYLRKEADDYEDEEKKQEAQELKEHQDQVKKDGRFGSKSVAVYQGDNDEWKEGDDWL